MAYVPAYRAPGFNKPYILFNIAMTGDTAKEVANKTGFRPDQVTHACTQYVPKCDFIAVVLTTYPSLSFNDLFVVVIDGTEEGTKYVLNKKMTPIPVTFDEAVGAGFKLEPSPIPGDNKLRINIYEDDKPVCGFGAHGEFYRYGKEFRESAVAQYISRVRDERGLTDG